MTTDSPEASGGSAPPQAPGPGSGAGASTTSTQLTGAIQTAANDIVDGLEGFSNHVFDAGEAGLQDALKVVDAAQTGVSNALTALAAKVTGAKIPDLPGIDTSAVGGALTGEAQAAANRALNGLQTFSNELFDIGEGALSDALKVVDDAQSKVSQTLSSLTGIFAGAGKLKG